MSNLAILYGSFHQREVAIMRAAAHTQAQALGLMVVHEVGVPGSMEKPLALKWLLSRPEVHAVVVLGIIERGETAHGRVMAEAVIQQIIHLQLDYSKPVGVGILGPEIHPHQIPHRLAPYATAAVSAAAHMLALKQQWG